MSRKLLSAGLTLQAALAGLAATLDWTSSCGACRTDGLSLGLVGFGFYAVLLLAALVAGPTRLVFGGIFFGFGVHVMLAAQMMTSGLGCVVCYTAAANSALLAGLSVCMERRNLARAAVILPWAVLLILAWNPTGPSPSEPARVRLDVYTQPDCGYCEELEENVLPGIESEFGNRLRVVRRGADELPALRMTPTLVVTGSDGTARAIEGLPRTEILRAAILEAEGRR